MRYERKPVQVKETDRTDSAFLIADVSCVADEVALAGKKIAKSHVKTDIVAGASK